MHSTVTCCKGPSSQNYDFFPVVMYGCESWNIKKAEHWRVDALELYCWRRLLRVPWSARRFNQSILKDISPEYPLEGLMLKLKLRYFGHLMWNTDSLEKTLMLRKMEGRRRTGRQRILSWLAAPDQAPRVCDGQGNLVCCSPWGCRVGHNWATELNFSQAVYFSFHW